MFVIGVHQWSPRRTKPVDISSAANTKIMDTAKFNMLGVPTSQIIHQRSFSWHRYAPYRKTEFRKLKCEKLHIFSPRPRVGTDIRARHINCPLCLISEDVATTIYILNILISYSLLICLIYLIILYVYLIFFSAVRFHVRCLCLYKKKLKEHESHKTEECSPIVKTCAREVFRFPL